MSFFLNPTNVFFSNNTDVNFRIWGKFISDSLLAGGLVKTADTGQVDWATVSTPPSSNTKQAYEIWRFADALQATNPVFIRIDYGSALSQSRPEIWITVGTGSNGSGSITNVLLSNHEVGSNETDTNATHKHIISVSNNSITFALNYNSTTPTILCIERTKNADFSDSATGVLYFTYGISVVQSGWVVRHGVLPFIGTVPPQEQASTFLIPASGSTADGANIGVFPFTHFYYGKNVNP